MADQNLKILIDSVFSAKGFEQANKATKDLESSFKGLGDIAKVAAGAIVGAFALNGIKDSIVKTLDFADSLNKMSQKVGVSVDALYAMQAAGKLADVDMNTLEKSLTKFNKGLGTASMGSGDTANALKNLGISLKDSSGHLKDSDKYLFEVADKFKAMPNGIAKSTLAMQLFGKSGADMIPLLNGGSEVLREFSGIMDKDSAQAAERLNDSFTRMGLAFEGNKTQILTGMLPAIESLSGSFEDFALWMSNHKDDVTAFTNQAGNDLTALGMVGHDAFNLISDTSTDMLKVVNSVFGVIPNMIGESSNDSINNFGFFEYFILGLSTATNGIAQFVANAKMAYADVAEFKAKYGSVGGLITNGGYDAASARLDKAYAKADAEQATKNVAETYNTLLGLKKQFVAKSTQITPSSVPVDLEDYIANEAKKEAAHKKAEADRLKLAQAYDSMAKEAYKSSHNDYENSIKDIEDKGKAYLDQGIKQVDVDKYVIDAKSDLKNKYTDKAEAEALAAIKTFNDEQAKLEFQADQDRQTALKTYNDGLVSAQIETYTAMGDSTSAYNLQEEEKMRKLAETGWYTNAQMLAIKTADDKKYQDDKIANYQSMSDAISKIDVGGIMSFSPTGDVGVDRFASMLTGMGQINDMLLKQAETEKQIAADRKKIDEDQKLSDLEKIELKEKLNKKENDLHKNSLKNEIASAAHTIALSKNVFKEKTAAYKAFNAIEKALNLASLALEAQKQIAILMTATTSTAASGVIVAGKTTEAVASATAGVANQASGDPYTAFPRIAAMIGLMGAVLAMGGIAFGGASAGGASVPPPDATMGTVLGGGAYGQSESITNITDLMDSIHTSEYSELRDINRAVTSMAQGIEGAVANLFRSGELDTSGIQLSSSKGIGNNLGAMGGFTGAGAGLAALYGTGIAAGALGMTGIGLGVMAIDKLLLNGALTNLIGGTVSKALGAVGLGGSSKQYIAGSGFKVAGGTLGSKADGNVGASTYVDVETASKNFWGSASYSHNITTTALDDASSKSIALIYDSFEQTMLSINEGLGTSLGDSIAGYAVKAINISTAGLTGDEVVKKLNDTFSALGDTMANDVFGATLDQYQKLGEGMLETAVRVITEKAVVMQELGDINKTIYGDVISISQSLVDLAGSLDNFSEANRAYYDNFFSDSEKQANSLKNLTAVFGAMNMAMPSTLAGFRSTVEALDLNSTWGREAYTSLMSVSSAFADVTKAIDETTAASIKAAFELTNSFTNSIRSFTEWKMGSGTVEQLGFTSDYISKDLADLEKKLGISGVTVDNFLSMYEDAAKASFTTETIDAWNNLGETLMKATNANVKYTDSLKALTASQTKPMDMIINKVKDSSQGITQGFITQIQNGNDALASIMTEVVRLLRAQNKDATVYA